MAEKVVRRSVTIPGVQPKLSMHLETPAEANTGRLTLVGLEGRYILKPPVEQYAEMPELEHLTMRLAEQFGVATVPCGLIPLEDKWCYITRRIDRTETGKLHMEDLCQLTDKLAADKYRSSLERVGKTIVRYSSNPLYDALRFFELTLFCFITGNADMHLKNFSLLHEDDGAIALAPAYDLLPTALLLPQDTEETALTLNGRKRKLTRRDFDALSRSLGLAQKAVENTWRRFLSIIPTVHGRVSCGFCAEEKKAEYRNLIQRNAAGLGLWP